MSYEQGLLVFIGTLVVLFFGFGLLCHWEKTRGGRMPGEETVIGTRITVKWFGDFGCEPEPRYVVEWQDESGKWHLPDNGGTLVSARRTQSEAQELSANWLTPKPKASTIISTNSINNKKENAK